MLIGHHIDNVNTLSKYVNTIHDKYNIKINVISIFVMDSYTYQCINDNIITLLNSLRMNIYVHNSYTINIWNDTKKSLHFIYKQLAICKQIQAKGFVIHLPKEKDIEYIIYILNKIKSDITIFLEIPALKPIYSYFHNIDNINTLFQNIKKHIKHFHIFGLCIDTAHLWSSGLDVSNNTTMEEWLNKMDKTVVKNIILHLNDNKKNIGVAPDMHAVITLGKIWKNIDYDNIKSNSLYTILSYSITNNIPIILERSSMKSVTMDYDIMNTIITTTNIKNKS